jgi:L-ascorbate metabolism protein UlaG (beta-lactamase superfamily)
MKLAALLLACTMFAGAAERGGEYFSTDSGPVTMSLVHHASFVIEQNGHVIYVDPTSEGNYKGLPKADLILITNDQPDHLDLTALNHVSRKSTAIIAPTGPAARLPHCTALPNGETVSMGEIVIQAVPAFQDLPKTVHEKGKGNGYVLTLPGLRVYISGDTGFFPEMKNIKNIDVAFLSMGTPDNMSLDDAMKAVQLIKPHVLYPYQYRDTNPDEIRKRLLIAGTEVRMRNWY